MSERSILDAIKVQANVVIPITKALERELGKVRAHAIIGGAIADAYVAYRERRGFELDTHPSVEVDGPAFPVEHTTVENTPDSYAHNVTHCEFANYFSSIGEPEIGALMTCGVDAAAEELMRPGWEYSRTMTRMSGAAVCDFHWRKKSPTKEQR